VQPQRAAPAANETPQRTTASYDDWIVECQTQTGPQPDKVCDMSQVAQVQQAQGRVPFSRVAITHPTRGQPVKLAVQVPVNVSLRRQVRIQMSDSDHGWSAPFTRCVPVGCFADFSFNDEALSKLRAAPGPGKVSFSDAGGHDIAVPLSFKGFSQAFEALAKEEKD
jgi:invasion protein IalB